MVRSIIAANFTFSPSAIDAPAGHAFTIAFSNADAAIPHNVMITSGAGAVVLSGKIITGVSSIQYAVPALVPGDYHIGCIVHPAMTGTLIVR